MIENIPAGWRVEKLENNICIQNGYSFKSQNFKDSGVPVVRINNIKESGLSLDNAVCYDESSKLSDFLIKKNDILLSLTGDDKNLKICIYNKDDKIYLNQRVAIIRSKKALNNKYLFYFIKKFSQILLNKANGIAQKNISVKNINSLNILIPPIKQQQKIVKVLDITTNLINQQQELLKQYDLFLKSKFIEMFGCPAKNTMEWNVKTIEEIVKDEKYSLKRGPFGGSLKKEIFVRDGYLVYEQFHALNNDFSMERYFIDEEKFNELKAFSVKGGDIIISCSGVYLGKLAIIPLNYKKGIINQALLKISLNEEKMNSVLFTYIFTNNNFKQRFFGNFIGSGIPNFPPMSDFKKFIFISPPINLQNRFADIVEKIENIKTQQNKKLLQLQDLHNSLMQKAFKGEIK
jgi:type I restriction enzyme S subunit